MAELIKVNYNADRITLSARELYEFLDVKSNFTTWIERMAEYGFTENVDYRELIPKMEKNPTRGRPLKDYEITLDMAKEIAMLQRSEKGKQCRQYFIEVEKKWKKQTQYKLPMTYKEALLQLVAEVDAREKLELENAELKPKALFADAITESEGNINIGTLAKLLRQNGIDIGRNKLFEWLRDNGYLIKGGNEYNQPKQPYVDSGLFRVVGKPIKTDSGRPKEKFTTYVTPKGQKYFIDKFLKFNLKGVN